MITSKLTFHSETGTEGGYWALMDETKITKITPDFGVFGRQEVYDQARPNRHGVTRQDAEVLKDGEWLPLPDPIQEEPDYYESSLFRGDRGDRDADQRLMDKYNFRIIYAQEQWDRKWGKGNWHYEDPETPDTVIGPDGERYINGGTLTEPFRPYGVGHGELTRVTVDWDDGQDAGEQRLSDSLLVERWSYDGLNVLSDGDHLTIYDKEDSEKIVWEGTIQLKEHPLFTEDAFGLWIHADQEGAEREVWAKWFMDGYPAALTKSWRESGESLSSHPPDGNPGTPNS